MVEISEHILHELTRMDTSHTTDIRSTRSAFFFLIHFILFFFLVVNSFMFKSWTSFFNFSYNIFCFYETVNIEVLFWKKWVGITWYMQHSNMSWQYLLCFYKSYIYLLLSLLLLRSVSKIRAKYMLHYFKILMFDNNKINR